MTARRPAAARRCTVVVGGLSMRFPARAARAGGILVIGIVAAAVAGLLIGDYDMTLVETLQAAFARGDDPLAVYFVHDVRAPRVVTALVVGAALGIAGCLFQNVTGNPLGSPDVIGFTTGAATGALMQIIVVGASTHAVGIGALVGGFLTAAVVLGLARSSGLDGGRLVLVGIGVGAALGALNSLLMVRASLVAAQTAAQWLAGSLNAVLWPRASLVMVAVALLAVPALLLARPLGMLALGDDTSAAVGIPVRRVRAGAVLTGVALVSVATAATGPIAFVALAAPQLSRRLAGVPTPGVVGSALMGALLVQVSDLVAQRLLAPDELAVGVVTGAVGGTYLIALLAGEWRRNRV